MLEFDAETTKILDAGYQGADIASRRHANLSALEPKSGQSILDLEPDCFQWICRHW